MEDFLKAFIALKDFVEERIPFGKHILNLLVGLALLFSLLWLATHVYELIIPIVLTGLGLAKGLIPADLFLTQLIASGLSIIIPLYLLRILAGVARILDKHNFMFDMINKRLEKLEHNSQP